MPSVLPLTWGVLAALGVAGVIAAWPGLPPEARPCRDAFLYAAVILVLLFRPQGLFGVYEIWEFFGKKRTAARAEAAGARR